MFISMHSILGWASFCMNNFINAAWHGGDQPVELLRCNESPGCFDSGLQFICIVGSGVSHLPLDNTPSILYRVQVRRVCGKVPSPARKWNQHLHKACQQKEASTLKFPGRWLHWLWTSENTVDQHQQMTWQPKSSLTVEISHWTSSNMYSVPLLSPGKMLLMMFLFQKWLGSPFPEDVWAW